MLLNRTKKTETPVQVVDLTARLAQLRSDIESTRRELIAAREEADQRNTDAILHGGSFDPTLQNNAEQLSVRLGNLEAQLKPLAAADRQQKAEAERKAVQAEAERIARLKGEYHEAARGILNAIRTVEAAQLAADAIHRQFPAHSVQRVVCFPGTDLEAGQFFRLREERLCLQGYADLFEPTDIVRLRFEQQEASERAAVARFVEQQKINQANAGAIVPEEKQDIPNRAPRQSKAGALVA